MVRVVDYLGNAGGGLRFTAEMLAALVRTRPEARFELVSHGASLERYRAVLGTRVPDVALVDVPPANPRDVRAVELTRVRGGRAAARLLGARPSWHFAVRPDALEGADVVWLPWMHRHRLPAGHEGGGVVASFQDAIFLTAPMGAHFHAQYVPEERATTAWWLGSQATIVASSHATGAAVHQMFGGARDRMSVIPFAGEHELARSGADAALPAEWRWARGPYLLTPSNVSPHKNHEVLLRGVARWGARHPLVLTGPGADLAAAGPLRRSAEALGVLGPTRSAQLGALARELGFTRGGSLVPLGYLSDAVYYPLLRGAWALVMPTKAEGYGLPTEEAVRLGVPVVCSDIPVLREHIERLGAEVLWFDPTRADDLADRLAELDADYPRLKRRAVEQVPRLARRTWGDVADEYWTAFTTSHADNRARHEHTAPDAAPVRA